MFIFAFFVYLFNKNTNALARRLKGESGRKLQLSGNIVI
jgi:hypothetical protein